MNVRGRVKGQARGKSDGDAGEPITAISIAANRMERVRGKPLDVEGVDDGSLLAFRGNTAAGSDADVPS